MTFNNDIADISERKSDLSSEVNSDDNLQGDSVIADDDLGAFDATSGDESGIQAEGTFTDSSDDVYAADEYSDSGENYSDDSSAYGEDDSQGYTGEWDNNTSENTPAEFDDFGNPVIANPNVTDESASSEEDSQWGATMTVGNTVYAATIFWQPLQDPDNPLPEVRETAENVLENADLYVIRPTGMPQYGLGISAEGHKSGMPVAALALADAFSDLPSSVAVFKVPEGWWFVAIRNDLILSEDDMLYKNEEDAKRTFLSMMAVPDWGRRIAPAEWGIEGTEELDIADVFDGTPKIKLSKLKSDFNIKTIAILALVIVLIAWGGFALLSHFSDTEEIIEEVASPPVVKPVVEKPKVFSIPMPWESIILPSDFINVCTKSTSQLVAAKVPGWVIGDIDCQQVGLSTSWNMIQGRLGNVQAALNFYNIDGLNFTISENGRSVIGSINFGTLKRTYSAPTMRAQEIVTELTDIFQALNIPLSVNISNVSPVATSEKVVQQEPYSYVNFSFSSNLPVSEWGIFFSNFDALELTSMVYNVNSNNWKYEGRIYGKK